MYKITALFLILFSTCVPARQQAFSVGFLNGAADIQGLRLGYRPTSFNLDNTWLGELDLYVETSISYWRYKHDTTGDTDSNYTFALTPVFIKEVGNVYDSYPVFLEAGIGIGIVSDQQFAGKDIGSTYQFEDKLGVVVALDDRRPYEQRLALRYMHYSNGGFNDDNPGVDFFNISYIHYF
ncbi:acyloxyacyl hydrolase [Alteromonas gilva]|uniref:Lipid A deacylase n=1 Tax=Alteromonas gilva TaxID=2987522 RepID=A0ABT5L5Z3_9ALTE|nr:acyloxyacyl hydrolase [Alteromonas gilva]MDC8831819.1 acyloxyacyl hydrolase [Alteromonas gilva]